MSMLRRWGYFFLTNILVIVTISLLMQLLGVGPYLTQAGIDYGALLIFCLVWGMAGSFISLALSRFSAKLMTGAEVIDPSSPGEYRWLVETVHDLSRKAKLPQMPQVAVYPSYEVNAFATGPTKSRSLVAVSAGLLSQMSRDQIEGVLAHEVAHIQNGDMVTMTLIQGVINAFTMFVARALAFAIAQNVEEDNRPFVRFMVTMLLDIVLGLFGFILVCWFSRAREFRADRGSARLLGGPNKMVSALQGLQQIHFSHEGQGALSTLKIAGPSGGLLALFSTHPPIPARIEALQRNG
jgi:heat shock protein HtpX